jgi:hypothetical protein
VSILHIASLRASAPRLRPATPSAPFFHHRRQRLVPGATYTKKFPA